MKIYTKIILDKNNNVLKEDSYTYEGPIEIAMGIHYDFKSTKGMRLMEKKAKRERKLAERKAKRQAKLGHEMKEEPNTDTVDTPLSLEEITNPNKNK